MIFPINHEGTISTILLLVKHHQKKSCASDWVLGHPTKINQKEILFVMIQNQPALQNNLKKNSEMNDFSFFFPVDVLNDIFFKQSYIGVGVGHWPIVEENKQDAKIKKNALL